MIDFIIYADVTTRAKINRDFVEQGA